MPDTKNIPIRYGKYISHEMEEEKVIFIGAEKAIYGADGRRLDEKLIDMEDSLSDAFSTEKDYAAGDYCVYANRVFKFTKAKAAGEWDGAAVIPVSLAQEIRANAQDIAAINGRLAFGGECTVFRSGLNMDQNLMTLQSRLDEKNYITLIATDESLYVDKIINGEVKRLFTTASKSDLGDPGAFKIVARGISDLDNPPNAFIIQTTAGNIVGFPTGLNANSCTVYQYNPGDKSYSAQVAFAFGADKIGIRRRNAASGSTAWTGWKYFTAS